MKYPKRGELESLGTILVRIVMESTAPPPRLLAREQGWRAVPRRRRAKA